MTEYVLPQTGVEEFERERLMLLEQVRDPFTVRQFDAIGVGEGWRCLDVGAGAGSVTRLLAERVGSTGYVLATDLDTRLLERLKVDRVVEVRRHDLLIDPLPDAEFDLAHARNLLMHLRSRIDALRRLVAPVRPGGWVAIGDVDFTTVELSKPNAAWGRSWSAFCDAVVAAGWDIRYGARMRSDLEALELSSVDAEYAVRFQHGGLPGARLVAMTIERLRDRMLAVGAAADDLDEAQRLLADPEIGFRGPTIWSAWGRRT